MILKEYALRYLAKLLIIITQLLAWTFQIFRPFLGPQSVCPFTIGCSEYALMQLKQQSLPRALKMIVKRLLLCNPITNYCKQHFFAPSSSNKIQ